MKNGALLEIPPNREPERTKRPMAKGIALKKRAQDLPSDQPVSRLQI